MQNSTELLNLITSKLLTNPCSFHNTISHFPQSHRPQKGSCITLPIIQRITTISNPGQKSAQVALKEVEKKEEEEETKEEEEEEDEEEKKEEKKKKMTSPNLQIFKFIAAPTCYNTK